MEALVQILVLMAFLAAGFLSSRTRLAPSSAVTDRAIKAVLWALLLVMGFRLGNSPELRSRLGEIGLLAAATAALTMAGTLGAIRGAYVVLDGVRARRYRSLQGSSTSTAADESRFDPGTTDRRSGMDWTHFRGPLVLLAIVVVGFAAGALAPSLAVDFGTISSWVLNVLLFMIGLQFAQSGLSLKSAFVRADTVLVPAATALGSLAGGLVVAWLFRLAAGEGLALAAGFGWYSLSGVIISDLGDPALGSAAFLANMLRESLALVLIPVLARTRHPYLAVGAGGATAMDVTLPLIEQCAGPDSVPVSFTSGAILSLLVPLLVPLVYRLG